MDSVTADVLQMDGVELRRKGAEILRGVSWSICRGEHWALIGNNGCGKTMLLRTAMGHFWPTEGSVAVLGRAFGSFDMRELKHEIGWVNFGLQHQFLQRLDTGVQVVASGQLGTLGVHNEKPSEKSLEKARELLSFMQCEQFQSRKFRTFSYGEQKRVLIARALMTKPKLLVLDEPCTGLDLAAREQFLEFVEHFSGQEGAPTIVFVSHHIEEVMPFITHCHVLKDGKTLRQGRKEDVLTSEVLSKAFNLPVEVRQLGERYWAHVNSKKETE